MNFTLFLDIAVAVASTAAGVWIVAVCLNTLRQERRADREAAWRRLEQLTSHHKEGL